MADAEAKESKEPKEVAESKVKVSGDAVSQSVRVNVKNLSPSCGADDLRALFEDSGTVTQVQVKTNPDGSGKGMGFVCYATQAEAEKAVTDMNGKVVEERALSVKIVDRRDAKGEGGKSKGKGKQKAPMMQPAPYWYGADPMAAMGYPAGFFEYSMANPYGYDLGAIYNAMYGSPNMFNGFSMPMVPEASAKGMSRGDTSVDPNTIAALQQAQLFALQSQVAQASKEEAKGKAKGKGKIKGKGKTQEKSAPLLHEAPPPDKEFVGSLKSLSGKNGYGFIACAEIQELFHRDVWVDSALLPEGVDPDERTQLKFNVTLSAKGHPQAKDVKLA